MRLHPVSLAVGAALMVGVGLLSAQQIVGSPAIVVRRVIEPVVTLEGAHPRDWVRVAQGSPYTVPPGRILVCTGLRHVSIVSLNTSGNESLVAITARFDGQDVLTVHTRWNLNNNHGSSGDGGSRDIPPGLAAPEGTIVEVVGGTLLGYLVDA